MSKIRNPVGISFKIKRCLRRLHTSHQNWFHSVVLLITIMGVSYSNMALKLNLIDIHYYQDVGTQAGTLRTADPKMFVLVRKQVRSYIGTQIPKLFVTLVRKQDASYIGTQIPKLFVTLVRKQGTLRTPFKAVRRSYFKPNSFLWFVLRKNCLKVFHL